MLASPEMTVLAEKSTLFPIRFPLTRPSLVFSLCAMDLTGLPDLSKPLGWPVTELSR